VAKKIIHTLVTPLQIGERKVDANVSLGIAMYPDHGADADTLMRNSDAAMYAAKRAQAGYRVFSAEMDQGSDQRLMLLADLRRAVAGEELVLFYQPKVDLTSNRIDGVEALVRWQHPTHGLLTPDKFISLAEQTGLIKPLTERVLTLALQQCARWRQSGLTLTMAVNVSTINIQDSEFPARVAELIQAAGVPASSLELEITETAVMLDPARAIDCITRLNALGLLIAIDDFGTGYSSMSYLKKLMIAKIKIDRSFVKDMTTHHHDGVIVRSTIELGHNLGLTVVAEGVENQASWDELKTLGCDAAQGYFFSRPVSADQFVEWLQNSEWGKRCVSSGSG
jgi:EAL domain-containing protein (putative c-di-GMP-specific phosphodiesterase class I)